MFRAPLGFLAILLAVPTLQAEEAAGPLFSRHVVPLFSRLGCNAGSCHGAVKGQNGFRLTLFGADPALDHGRLVREFGGRRLDFHTPETSLLLLKATGQIPQGTHSLRVSVPSAVAGGAATAKLTLVDTAGHSRTLSTPVTVPA